MNTAQMTGEKNAKRQLVYETIKKAIIKFEIRPDEPLVERVLSEQLGVSRTPIRDAMRMLEAEGLVRSIAGMGTFVTPVTIEDYLEITDLKQALESLAAELCCKRGSQEIIGNLAACFDRERQAIEDGRFDLVPELDVVFHRAFVHGSGNRRLVRSWENIAGQSERFIHIARPNLNKNSTILPQHRAILDGIKSGDPQKAREAVAAHNASIQNVYLEQYF